MCSRIQLKCICFRNYFLHIFGEHTIDVEIRLAAYLQVMRCPKYVTMIEILRILKNEKIQQGKIFSYYQKDVIIHHINYCLF